MDRPLPWLKELLRGHSVVLPDISTKNLTWLIANKAGTRYCHKMQIFYSIFLNYFCNSEKRTSGDSLHGSSSCVASDLSGATFLTDFSNPSEKRDLSSSLPEVL